MVYVIKPHDASVKAVVLQRKSPQDSATFLSRPASLIKACWYVPPDGVDRIHRISTEPLRVITRLVAATEYAKPTTHGTVKGSA